MHTVLLMTRPSDPIDPRNRMTRSPNCPNNIEKEEVSIAEAGTCGTCAWGFYRTDAEGHQPGEPVEGLELSPVYSGQQPAGYKAQCGSVRLMTDKDGRVGAVRKVGGEDRFFAGIKGNWAFDRYTRTHTLTAEPQKAVA